MRLIASVLLLVACTGAPTVEPPALDPLPQAAPVSDGAFGSYTLRFPQPGTQYFEVELVLPHAESGMELRMAAWTPGSYLIRDYAKHVDTVTADDGAGNPLSIDKVGKDTWKLEFAGDPQQVVVRYRVYAAELNVRGNWVEPSFAQLNGAPTYLIPVGHEAATYDVRLERPDAWAKISTALPPHPSGEANRFRVGHYDVLVDSPIVLGYSTVSTFEVADPARPDRMVRHRLVHEGDLTGWNTDKAARDVERVTREIIGFWGGIPYDDYTYLNLVVDKGGGLEHKASTLMHARRWPNHKKWLGLVSHEYFHTWNVKRMRPVELGPFDLSAERYTRSLWIAEGLTSYYDDLILRRAGLLDDEEYLGRMSDNLRTVQRKPGRFTRSLEDASLDAWIKYYQADENHDNVSVSYYSKGAVVGFMLDAEIRDRSGGWASLDDCMRLVYSRHSGESGFTPEQFQAACEEVATVPLDDFFERYVRGTDELDYSTAVRVFGLRFKTDAPPEEDEEPTPTTPWLGMSVSGGTVRSIVKDGPCWDADVIAQDELIAIDGYRVHGSPDALLKQFRVGQEVALTLSRRGQLRTTSVVLAPMPDLDRYALEIDPQAPIEAKDRRKKWLASALGEAEVEEETGGKSGE